MYTIIALSLINTEIIKTKEKGEKWYRLFIEIFLNLFTIFGHLYLTSVLFANSYQHNQYSIYQQTNANLKQNYQSLNISSYLFESYSPTLLWLGVLLFVIMVHCIIILTDEHI
jgi:NADH:ubiquinone oxidoreductase subunit 6 (subunit J)